MIDWNELTSENELDEITLLSEEEPCVIFKHSIRCSLSGMILSRLERSMENPEYNMYLLDLINYRPLSNKIAESFGVQHESPQVLVLKNGKCIFAASHTFISADAIDKAAKR